MEKYKYSDGSMISIDRKMLPNSLGCFGSVVFCGCVFLKQSHTIFSRPPKQLGLQCVAPSSDCPILDVKREKVRGQHSALSG